MWFWHAGMHVYMYAGGSLSTQVQDGSFNNNDNDVDNKHPQRRWHQLTEGGNRPAWIACAHNDTRERDPIGHLVCTRALQKIQPVFIPSQTNSMATRVLSYLGIVVSAGTRRVPGLAGSSVRV